MGIRIKKIVRRKEREKKETARKKRQREKRDREIKKVYKMMKINDIVFIIEVCGRGYTKSEVLGEKEWREKREKGTERKRKKSRQFIHHCLVQLTLITKEEEANERNNFLPHLLSVFLLSLSLSVFLLSHFLSFCLFLMSLLFSERNLSNREKREKGEKRIRKKERIKRGN